MVKIRYSHFTPCSSNVKHEYLTEVDGNSAECSAQNTNGLRNAISESLLTKVVLGPSVGVQNAINSKL